jgi:hypothetical protein
MDPADEIPANTSLPQVPPRRDALTILRILLLTAGVAVGIKVFIPEDVDGWTAWRTLFNAAVIGLSLPAPLFVMGAVRRVQGPLGPGSLFAMAMGGGALLLLPPPVIVMFSSHKTASPACVYYIMPQVALWFLLAALLTGQINRRLFDRRQTPWTERYGYFLALLWSPLGIFHLVRYYRQALWGSDFFE